MNALSNFVLNASPVLVLTALLGSSIAAHASDADLDTAFSYDGFAVLCAPYCPGGLPPPSHDHLTAMLPMANGHYAMVGIVDNEAINGPLVAFSEAASTEYTTVVTPIHGQLVAAAEDQAGRFYVLIDPAAGSGAAVTYASTVMRFGSNFVLDTTFGSGGSVTITFPGFTVSGLRAIAIDHSQRIVVAGSAGGGSSTSDMAVARLLATGAYDAAFGTSGRQTIGFDPIATSADVAQSIDVAGDDGLLLTGSTDGNLSLARLKTSGELDSSFNGTGKRVTNLPIDFDAFTGPPLGRFDHAGRILVALPDRMMRFLASGEVDAAFLGSAPSSTPGNASVTFTLYAFAERSDGRLVLAGTAFDNKSGTGTIEAARLLPSGADDNTFNNGNNMAPVNLNATISHALAILVDAGRPVIAGEWYSSTVDVTRWCVVRLQSDLIFQNPLGD